MSHHSTRYMCSLELALGKNRRRPLLPSSLSTGPTLLHTVSSNPTHVNNQFRSALFTAFAIFRSFPLCFLPSLLQSSLAVSHYAAEEFNRNRFSLSDNLVKLLPQGTFTFDPAAI